MQLPTEPTRSPSCHLTPRYNLLTDDDWYAFNTYRAEKGLPMTYPKPSLHMHVYGKNDEGYWTGAHMVALTTEFLHLFEWLYRRSKVTCLGIFVLCCVEYFCITF
jgi:hypothetical protein